MYPADDLDDYDESSPSDMDVDASAPSGDDMVDDPPLPYDFSSNEEILALETPDKEHFLLDPRGFVVRAKL